jgi:serpin B
MTTLILTNAVFFKGEWLHVFDPDSTEEGSFLLQSGQSVRVPMMRQSAEFGYLRRKDFQAIRLPYSGREIALLVILPDEGRFDTLAQAFDPTLSADVNRELSRLPVRLKMPRFRLRSALHAKDGLAKLGLHNPFSAEANFGGISPMGDLFISELLHQSHISLDEAGTEATAASAVAMSRSMPSHEMVILTVDRPFLFVIHDLPSDTALFLGQVMDPSGERELSVANPAR